MRSIHELLNLALLDVRLHMGTYKDWSPTPETVTPTNGPGFSRCLGQVVAASFTGANQSLQTTADSPANGAFGFEALLRITGTGAVAGASRIWASDSGTPYLVWDSVNTRLILAMGGGSIASAVGSVVIGDTFHVAGGRSSAGNGTLYIRSLRGYFAVTGAVGTSALSNVVLMNNLAGNRDVPGYLMVARLFSDAPTDEEAALLYEHSRILLQPGAPKRSGIMSVR